MKVINLLFVCAIFFLVDHVSAEENLWDYSPSGPTTVNEVTAGRAGNLRVFACQTTDSVEKVVLWYAKRLRLKDDHSLIKTASQGFDKVEGRDLQLGAGHDTDQLKDYTYVSAQFVKGGPHISIWHRPDFRQTAIVTISIAKVPAGTSVHVIEQLLDKDAKISRSGSNVEKSDLTR